MSVWEENNILECDGKQVTKTQENPVEMNAEKVEEFVEFWIHRLASAVPTLEQWKLGIVSGSSQKKREVHKSSFSTQLLEKGLIQVPSKHNTFHNPETLEQISKGVNSLHITSLHCS